MVTPELSRLQDRARKVVLVLTDCDGVLTDAGVYFSEHGEAMKRFFIRDGMGMERLRRLADVETGIITGERSPSVVHRAKKLGLDTVFLGVKHKLEVFESLLRDRKLAPEQVAYIGDDVNDLEVLQSAGLSASPADGMDEVKRQVHYVCRLPGGHGAFREFAELILSAKLGARS